MKHTIEGFSQEYALTLKKTVADKNGKEKTIKIDFTDFVILRWFVDFYPNMKKMIVDGREYAWLSHNKLMTDLPLLDISKRACIDRMQKLVAFEILDYQFIKDGGTFSLYAFGKNYINLVASQPDTVEGQDNTGVYGQPYTGVCGQPYNKDNNTIYKSINDSKKERKKTSYDDILADIQDDTLKELYLEYIKMRKLIKSPLTDRALKMLIDKVERLEPFDIQRQKQMLENAIMNNWKSVYPLKDENIKRIEKRPQSTHQSQMDELKRLYAEAEREENETGNF